MAYEISTFRFDVTPPIGHPLCGGWIKPATVIDDALEAIGIVIYGAGEPVVLCAIDWCSILNETHVAFREALARGTGTTPDRVAVQSVHQHNAPFACTASERIVADQKKLGHVVDLAFIQDCLEWGESAARQAEQRKRPLTHLATGRGQVEQVASNRRIVDDRGRLIGRRSSSCQDETLRAYPDGMIDRDLRTVAFYSDKDKVASLHYYATHPMSYYGDGRVTSDFAGLARKRRQAEDPGATHLYFTGCAGDVAAGKYNDGSHELRKELIDRIHEGIIRSESSLAPVAVDQVGWRTAELYPTVRDDFAEDELFAMVQNPSLPPSDRIRPAMKLVWLRRCQDRQVPIIVSALSVGDVTMLHLPGECFVEYQLRAQAMKKERFVCTAAYGDGGPWYVPVKTAFPQGGYEVEYSFCGPSVDEELMSAIEKVLA